MSQDAVNWTALNNNRPIIPSSEISQTGGIRDPHLLRGAEEKAFYMVATDMFTIRNGWESNPGIILMKSDNLVDWRHSIIDLPILYPEKFKNVKWVWAPQTIYDPKVQKYMVYFTVRYHDDAKLDFYAAYANEDFSGFEQEPKLLFSPKYGGIDGDIVYKDGLYHLFFKGNTKDTNGKEFKNGIRQATSKSLQGPWNEYFTYLDAYADTTVVVEGSSIFKRNDSNDYILMYDLYANGRYEFQRSTDLFKFTHNPESFTKDFHPRHGSVINITREEAQRLQQKWGGVPTTLLQPRETGERFHLTTSRNQFTRNIK
ncbi:1,4-beta-xylanase [Sphingobacterium olei]|uniref:1,4-beta-xylanase n=1 Tax=Sphingobacterium olei TaxID=2571155 RepID=A0A4U0P6I8_9SPHI|nr:1,4-beta-xylanase [Sphingobacterium olei]